MSVTQKIYEMELRVATSSFYAGLGEVIIRWITGIEFFGYLGVGLMLYGLFHLAQTRRAYNDKKRK